MTTTQDGTGLVARLHGVRDIRLTREPKPVPAAGESLVEITAVGLCGSDLHWYTEGGIGDALLTRPLVGGHEMAGVIRGGARDGQHVAVDPAIPCGHCDMCRRGDPNLCRNIVFAGHSTCDGGLQQWLAWPDALLPGLPPGMDDATGAMLEPLGVAVHAVDLGHVPLGGSVAVLGCGPIGLALLQVARAAGADLVVAADPRAHRRAAATRLGADIVLDPGGAEYAAELSGVADGSGVDVAFEVAGEDAAIASAAVAVRPGGRVVLAGIPSTADSAFPAATARRKGLTLLLVRRMKDVYPRAIRLVESGRVDVASIVSDRFPLSRAHEAFAAAVDRRGLKVLVTPGDDG